MKYPFFVVACFFGLGIYLNSVAVFAFPILFPAFLFAPLLLYMNGRRSERPDPGRSFASLYFLAAMCAVTGAGWISARSAGSSNAPARYRTLLLDTSGPSDMNARINAVSVGEKGPVRLVLENVFLKHRGPAPAPVAGHVLVNVTDSSFSQWGVSATQTDLNLHAGDEVQFSCTLEPLPKKRNPFDFDYGLYLKRKGIAAICSASESEIMILDHRHSGLLYAQQRVRSVLHRRIQKRFPSRASSSFINAVILGEKRNIDTQIQNDFRRTGLAHLLAISGLHTGIVGLTCYWLAGLWSTRLKIGSVGKMLIRVSVVAVSLGAYALISGGSASVLRSVIMTILYVVGRESGRRSSGWNILGLSAVVILVLDPSQLYGAGFQLSYSALAGILLSLRSIGESGIVLRPGRVVRAQLYRRISKFGKTSFFLLATTAPVLVFHFGLVPMAGIAANAVAIPVTSLIVLTGFLSTILPPISILTEATDVLIQVLFYIVRISSVYLGQFFLTAASGQLNGWSFLPLGVLLILTSGRSTRVASLFIVLFLLLIFVWERAFAPPARLQITFLDVGQGDASVVLFPSGRSLVIDTGPNRRSGDSVVRHLKGLGIRRLDVLVLTHLHRDHTGGVEWLASQIPIERVVTSGTFPDAKKDWFSSETDFVRKKAGDTLSVDQSSRVQILAPGESNKPGESEKNTSSIVIRLAFGTQSFLFTGDAELPSEKEIVRTYGRMIQAEILKVGHHGSKTSSSRSFLIRALQKKGSVAVISVGRKNRFGHPSIDVLDRLRYVDAVLCMTMETGGITFFSDGEKIFIINNACKISHVKKGFHARTES